MTKEEKLKWQRNRRKITNNASTKKYEKTVNGFLMRTHRNMRSRTLGIQKERAHLYLGLNCLAKSDFYKWAKGREDFIALWNAWIESGYSKRLTPSIHRIDSLKGYEVENMKWITHSENSKLGGMKSV